MVRPIHEERDPNIINKHFPVERQKPGRKGAYKMKNGVVTRDDIFLYTPENTIPATELDRFLEQCDNMIIMLDPRKVNKSEVEEIAKVYRESMVADKVYETLAEEGATLDPGIMVSLDKLLKAVEKRKENLAIRASDKEESRDFNKEFTMIDILTQSVNEVDRMEQEEKELSVQMKSVEKSISKVEEFVEDKVTEINEHSDKS
jgi:hypothetical protein